MAILAGLSHIPLTLDIVCELTCCFFHARSEVGHSTSIPDIQSWIEEANRYVDEDDIRRKWPPTSSGGSSAAT